MDKNPPAFQALSNSYFQWPVQAPLSKIIAIQYSKLLSFSVSDTRQISVPETGWDGVERTAALKAGEGIS